MSQVLSRMAEQVLRLRANRDLMLKLARGKNVDNKDIFENIKVLSYPLEIYNNIIEYSISLTSSELLSDDLLLLINKVVYRCLGLINYFHGLIIGDAKMKEMWEFIASEVKNDDGIVYLIWSDEYNFHFKRITEHFDEATLSVGTFYKIVVLNNNSFILEELWSFRYKEKINGLRIKSIDLSDWTPGGTEIEDLILKASSVGYNGIILSGMFFHGEIVGAGGEEPKIRSIFVKDRSSLRIPTLSKVIEYANSLSIKVFLDFPMTITSCYPSSKYSRTVLKVARRGREFKMCSTNEYKLDNNDAAYCLNYSDFETWEQIALDFRILYNQIQGISGITFTNLLLKPRYFMVDISNLHRKEIDEGYTYSDKMRFKNYVISESVEYMYGANIFAQGKTRIRKKNAFCSYIVSKFLEHDDRMLFLDYITYEDIAIDFYEDLLKSAQENGVFVLLPPLTNSEEIAQGSQETCERYKKLLSSEALQDIFIMAFDSSRCKRVNSLHSLLYTPIKQSFCYFSRLNESIVLKRYRLKKSETESMNLHLLCEVKEKTKLLTSLTSNQLESLIMRFSSGEIAGSMGNIKSSCFSFSKEERNTNIASMITDDDWIYMINLSDKEQQFVINIKDLEIRFGEEFVKVTEISDKEGAVTFIQDLKELLSNGHPTSLRKYEFKALKIERTVVSEEDLFSLTEGPLRGSIRLCTFFYEDSILIENSLIYKYFSLGEFISNQLFKKCVEEIRSRVHQFEISKFLELFPEILTSRSCIPEICSQLKVLPM